MKLLNLCLSLVIIVFLGYSCGPSNEFKATNYNAQNPDFSFLDEALEGKRIVALGESSHGFGDLHKFKGEMVKYMHQNLGYEVLMMEAGYGDTKITWENIELAVDGDQIKNNTLSKYLRSDELRPLFDYIKEKSDKPTPLIYSGYDSQISGNAYSFKLQKVIRAVDIRIIKDSIVSGLESFQYMFALKDSLEGWNYYKNKLIAGVDLGISVLDDNKEEILEKSIATEKELQILSHTLDNIKQSVDYEFGGAYTSGIYMRDSLMAQNIIKQIETEYKGKKVIIWGHNGHVEKGGGLEDNAKWMGHFLSEKYKDEYYSIGMFCKKGSLFTHWNKTNKPFNIDKPGFIEKTLADSYGGNVFANLPVYSKESKEWYNDKVFAFEPDAGGNVSFIPTQRFDGVLLLENTKVPTFTVKSSR